MTGGGEAELAMERLPLETAIPPRPRRPAALDLTIGWVGVVPLPVVPFVAVVVAVGPVQAAPPDPVTPLAIHPVGLGAAHVPPVPGGGPAVVPVPPVQHPPPAAHVGLTGWSGVVGLGGGG